MRKVFISYARANKPAVDELVEHLRELGCDTWVDSALYGGQDWWQEILRRIADCDVFIPIISHDALNSVACAREFDWAEALAKPVLPVAIEPPSVALPTRFSRRQFIDYSKSAERDRAARRLGGGLMSLPPAPPLPRPAPPRPAAPLSYLADLVDMVSRAKPLHPEEQRQILVRLKPALRSLDPEERRGGLAVLDRFGSRADLASDIDRSIAALKQHNDDANRIPQAPPPPRVRPTESQRPVLPIPPRPQSVRAAPAPDPMPKRATQGRPEQSSKSGPLYSNLGAPGRLLLLAALSGYIPPLVAMSTSYEYPIQVWWLQTLSRILLGPCLLHSGGQGGDVEEHHGGVQRLADVARRGRLLDQRRRHHQTPRDARSRRSRRRAQRLPSRLRLPIAAGPDGTGSGALRHRRDPCQTGSMGGGVDALGPVRSRRSHPVVPREGRPVVGSGRGRRSVPAELNPARGRHADAAGCAPEASERPLRPLRPGVA